MDSRLVALAEKLNVSLDELLDLIAGHEFLIRQIEYTLTFQLQLRRAAEHVTLLPPGSDHPPVADIRLTDGERGLIRARTSKRVERVVEIARSLGYDWTGDWWTLAPLAHEQPATDRAIELACLLLHAGIGVNVPAPLVERIRAGDYTPVHYRWIRCCTEDKFRGWFRITWNRRECDYWDAAIKIAGAQYGDPFVVVPPSSVDELLDFASLYDFRLTPAAEAAIEQARRALWQLDKLMPLPETLVPKPIRERPTLEAEPAEVDDELRDEPL